MDCRFLKTGGFCVNADCRFGVDGICAEKAEADASGGMTAAQLVEEAIQLADSFARAEVECNCRCVSAGRPPHWDTSAIDPDSRASVERSIRYCEMRKLLKRLPDRPHVVYFV